MAKTKSVPLAEKVEIFRRYGEDACKEIRDNTRVTFDGIEYNLGMWRMNLRAEYAKGKLDDVDIKLVDDLKALDIIGEPKRNKRTSDEEKYKIIKEYIEGEMQEKKKENPNEKITIYSVSSGGKPIGQYRIDLRIKYNDMNNGGDSHISDELIEKLKKIGVLDYDYSEIKNKTGLQQEEVDYIVRRYGSVEEFSRLFKIGKIKSEDLGPIKIEKLRNNRYIDIKNPGSEREENYSDLITEIFGEPSEGYGVVGLYDEGKIKDGLSKLSPREMLVLKSRFGLDDGQKMTLEAIGKMPGISEIFENIGSERVRGLEARALRNLRHPSKKPRTFIFTINLNEESLENKIAQEEMKIAQEEKKIVQEEKKITQEEKKTAQEEMEIKQEKKEIREEESKIVSGKYYSTSNNKIGNADGANGKNIEVFAKGIKMEHLDLSPRAKNRLDEKGINYVSDLADKSLGDLLKIEKFGPASFKELIGKLKAYGIVIPEDNETKFIKGEEADKIIKDIVYLNKRREILAQREEVFSQRKGTLDQRKKTNENSFPKRKENVENYKKHIEELIRIKKAYDYYISDEYSIFKENVITKKDIKNDIPDVKFQEEPAEPQKGKTAVKEKIEQIKALDNKIAEISDTMKKLEEERKRLEAELNKEEKGSNSPNRKEGINR